MNANTYAENRVQEIVEEVKYYMSEGLSSNQALEIVLSETCLSKTYKNEIISQIN